MDFRYPYSPCKYYLLIILKFPFPSPRYIVYEIWSVFLRKVEYLFVTNISLFLFRQKRHAILRNDPYCLPNFASSTWKYNEKIMFMCFFIWLRYLAFFQFVSITSPHGKKSYILSISHRLYLPVQSRQKTGPVFLLLLTASNCSCDMYIFPTCQPVSEIL